MCIRDSGYSDRFLVAGGRNGDVFVKIFDTDGNTFPNFGNQGEAIQNLGGNAYISSMVRLNDGSFILFAKTQTKVVCLKLNANGNWNNGWGDEGRVEIFTTGDFEVFSAISDEDEVYFSTGTNQLHKMNAVGDIDNSFEFLSNLYLDLNISALEVMPDSGLLLSLIHISEPTRPY